MTLTYVLHDDYEEFATRYLGIDYEDYVNMLGGYDDSLYELDGIEYEVPSVV